MSKPQVSVLVPVFNGEMFLAECLDSVLAQDFTDFEVLIGDNQSTDGTVKILERYARQDPRIRWWQNPVNLGMGGNFNACLRAARGDFLKFVMHDDLLLAPSALRRMAAVLEGDASVSLVGSAAQLLDVQGQPLRVRPGFPRPGVSEGRQVILDCLSANANLIGEPSTVMFRRSQAGRGFDEQLKQWLDLEMWFHLLEQGRFASLAEPLCGFRQHAGQESEVNRRSGTAAGEWFLVLEKYYAKTWVREALTPQTVFSNLRYLRRHPEDRTAALRGEMAGMLNPPTYAICWVKHRLARLSRGLAGRSR